MAKLPSFQFYPGDWMKDPDLRRCTRAERGMWIDMLCLMFECQDRGVLASGSQPWSDQEIAAAVGGDTTDGLVCLSELLRKGVAHRNTTGAIFSKRMVKDEQIRKARQKAGKLGGNPSLLNQNGSKPLAKGKQKPTPSSSSSSSDTLPTVEAHSRPAPEFDKSFSEIPNEARLKEIQADPQWSNISVRQAFGEFKEFQESHGKIPNEGKFVKEWLPNEVLKLKVKKLKPAPDPRSQHPGIVAVRKLLERYPDKVFWDDLIEMFGDQPDIPKLINCRKAWIGRGHNPAALTWATEWYKTGVPPRQFQGAPPPEDPAQKCPDCHGSRLRNNAEGKPVKCNHDRLNAAA